MINLKNYNSYFMDKKRKSILYYSLIVFLLFTTYNCDFFYFKGEPKEELDGLYCRISSIDILNNELIEIVYVLKNTKKPTNWLLKKIEPLVIKLWDINKKRIKFSHSQNKKFIIIPDELLTNKETKIIKELKIKIDPSAFYVSIALGNSGLETKKTEIK